MIKMNSRSKIFRTLFLILFLSVTGFILPRLIFDDSLQNWVPQDSKIVKDYQSFLMDFKSDAFIIFSIVDSTGGAQDIFSETINGLIKQISQMQHVRTVRRWPPPFLQYKTRLHQDIQSFFITYLPPSHTNPNRPDLIQNLTNFLNTASVDYHLAGTGLIHKAINDMTRRASRRFLGIGLSILFILLFLLIRNFQVILKTLGISLGSVAFVILTAYLLNIQFNLIMSILPILILFYSTSVSIHILNHQGDFKKVFWPTLTAVLTTCAGFSVFLLESAPLLRDFGLLAIIGLAGGLFWAVILFYPDKNSVKTEFPYRDKMHLIKKYWNIRSLFLGMILFIFLIPGALRIKSEINTLYILPRSNRTIQDYLFIEKHVGPSVPIEYRVDMNQTDNQDLRDWIEAVYRIDKVGAVMSYLAIPAWLDSKKLGYVSKDGNTGRVTFFVPMLSTTEGLALVHQIDNLAMERFPDSHVIPKPTGYVSLYVSVAHHLAKSFRESLLLAFIFVFLIIFIYLRSLKLFLASILPNLFPVLAIVGVMGWFHIPLDMVTVPIGCLALGIIVDDTIHFLYWYRKTENLHLALEKAGPGIVITSLISILGFSVFLFAEAPPVRYFGILSITAMITALFADIVILPVLLEPRGRFKKKIRRSIN